MARCLITGAAGFIGSHIADALVERNHEVYGIDNFETGKKKNVNPNVYLLEQSILDVGLMNENDKIGDVDYVFHAAAKPRVQPSLEQPIDHHFHNVVGTMALLEFCKEKGAKIILSSSSSVYDDTASLPSKEDGPKAPKSPYALQKLQSEEYVELYGLLYDIDYMILRYFNVYGERQLTEGAYAAVVGIFMQQRANGEPLSIFGDGEKRRDFTYVGDVVDANLRAMEASGTANIGYGDNVSINELADMIGGDRQYLQERAGEAQATLADNELAREKFGWSPTKSIGEWIKEQYATS